MTPTTQPSMAHLPIEEPEPGFDVLLQQVALQVRIHNERGEAYKPVADTEAEFLECFRMNVEADLNENAEILDRLPWKEWRSEHRGRVRDGVKLSPEDRLEIKFELVDKLHFLLNIMIRAGFESWREVEAVYWAKNRENFDRQERGY